MRFENLHVKTGAELSSQSRPQVGEGCALGMLRPRLRRLVLLDHDQSVASLVQRVELNSGFVVNSGDRRLESRDYVGAMFRDGKAVTTTTMFMPDVPPDADSRFLVRLFELVSARTTRVTAARRLAAHQGVPLLQPSGRHCQGLP